MGGIRVNTGAKKIPVNDEGEYIVLNFGDQDFPNRFYAMLDRIEERTKSAKDEEADIREKCEKSDMELTREMAAFLCDLHRYIMCEIDALFGPDTCRKVFGGIVPGIEMFDDFFTQLLPYFEECAKERADKLSKYRADRTGNV